MYAIFFKQLIFTLELYKTRWYNEHELEQFEVEVQSLERTLVDKTFAICDYYLSNKCANHSRHIYDIKKIMTQVELNSSLIDLFKQVREYRKGNPICYSASESFKLGEIVNDIITDNSFEDDYKSKTRLLLYESVAYEECVVSLKKLSEFLNSQNY